MWDIGFNPMTTQLNGFTTYVINSDEITDAIIRTFENAIAEGLNSEEALEYALKFHQTSLDELTYADRNRINRKVESVSSGSFNTKERNKW